MSANQTYNDPELLLRIAKGDELAFQDLLDRYAPLLFTYLNTITFDRLLAEELVQDVFLKIWQTRETLAQIQNFKGYLFAMTRNQSINLVKKVMRQQKLQQDWVSYSILQNSSETTDQEWKYSLIDKAIEQLPPQQKAVLIKSRKEGMKLDDIAQEMQLTKTTVKKYLQRAFEFIVQYVKQYTNLLFYLLIKNIF